MPPIVAPQTAKAIARDLPTNTALITDKEAGKIIAAPTPCSARAPMRLIDESEIATSTLAPTKTMTPMMKSNLRPKRSARRPARISSEAKVNE